MKKLIDLNNSATSSHEFNWSIIKDINDMEFNHISFNKMLSNRKQ